MKGSKVCQCGYIVGCRTLICPKCKQEFHKKERVIKTDLFSGKGKKLCKCGIYVGVRCKECPKCGYRFVFTPDFLKEKVEKIDWTTLKKNDKIKVKGGPIWKTKDTIPQRIPMGYKGIFKVMYVEKNGICAYGLKSKDIGYVFLYMGDRKISENGTILKAHKIVKVKRNEDR